jgi:hypothetical protein
MITCQRWFTRLPATIRSIITCQRWFTRLPADDKKYDNVSEMIHTSTNGRSEVWWRVRDDSHVCQRTCESSLTRYHTSDRPLADVWIISNTSSYFWSSVGRCVNHLWHVIILLKRTIRSMITCQRWFTRLPADDQKYDNVSEMIHTSTSGRSEVW